MSTDILMELITALGPMGFVMWLVHRTTTHTIPRLAKSFEDNIRNQRDDFKEMMTQQRSDYERLHVQQRADFERMTQRLQESHIAQIDKVVEAFEKVK